MASQDFWGQVIAVGDAVSKELERLRVAGGIGSGLDAEVDLYCEPALRAELGKLDGELRFVLITSEVRLHPLKARGDDSMPTEIPGLYVAVTPSGHEKCIRCWHHREDVGASPRHPEICGRCAENVAGAGEERRYA